MPSPFNFNKDPVSVVCIEYEDSWDWYHLSKGDKSWKLRRFLGNNPTPEIYMPQLVDLEDGAEPKEELSLQAVEQLTERPASSTSALREPEKWLDILTTLCKRRSPARSTIAAPATPNSAVQDTAPIAERCESAERVIPITGLRNLYALLKDLSSEAFQLAMAREVTREPVAERLGDLFQLSIRQFAPYRNLEGFHVRTPILPDPVSPPVITKTRDLTALLFHCCKHDRSVDVDGSSQLGFRYVDHEIAPSRTTGGAVYWDQRPARRGKTIDWLLVNSSDRTPIIAEVKIGTDKNPFFALIQTLMYASELVTESQIERIRKRYPGIFQLPNDGEELTSPLVDIYIVLHKYNQKASKDKRTLLNLTSRLSRLLIGQQAVSTYIRRIACLEAGIGEDNALRMSKIFVFPEE